MSKHAGECPLQWPFKRTTIFDPPPEYAKARGAGPVTAVRLWNGDQAYLVTTHKEARQVLSSSAMSSDPSRPGFPSVNATAEASKKGQKFLSRMDAPRHDEQRRILARDFAVGEIERLAPYVEQMVDDLLDRMEQRGGPVDLVQDFAVVIPSRLIFKLLNFPEADAQFFRDRVITAFNHDIPPESATGALLDILDYCGRIVTERETAPAGDLVSRLILNHVRRDMLTHEELKYMLLMLLLGGFDTTSNMISIGTLALLENPEQLEALTADPSLINGAVEEMLRYLSIAHTVGMRLAVDDLDVAGHHILAGAAVLAPVAAANRDPLAFPDPDKLDIRRNARGHLAFGFGIHQCLGQPMARMELRIVFSKLFQRFPTLRLAVPKQDLVFRDSNAYSIKALPVTW
jgi:cytochrome P450